MSLKSKHPLLFRFVAYALVPILIVAFLGYRYLRSSLPQHTGQVDVAGISTPVTIRRDERGATYIQADSDNDAFFALGYAHAQDRLWQLEVQRRIVRGTLSEIFGSNSISSDRWFRTLGLIDSAQKTFPLLGPRARASLEAYAAGVNAWIDSDPTLPPEFLLLRTKPKHWQPTDSLAWVKIFALNLSGNFRLEIQRYLAQKVLDEDKLHALQPEYPDSAPTTVRNYQAPQPDELATLLNLQYQLQDQWGIGGKYVGSNAWVVAGRFTDTGSPILANDPHLDLQIPSLWYVADLRADRLAVSGVSLVGLPIIMFGKNQHIAWGGTNMMGDVQDLYFELVNPDDPNQYQYADEWLDFEVKTELIEVKKEFFGQAVKPISIEVRKTIHGPVISDVLQDFSKPVALRSTVFSDNDKSYEAFFDLNFAKNWDEFEQVLGNHVAPPLNILYSDRQGNIGYVGAGKIPIRGTGQGLLPVAGWNPDNEWLGYIPSDQMPTSFNPERGYLISANHKVAPADYPYFISKDWAPPARAQRIENLLLERIRNQQPISEAYTREMQLDVGDQAAHALLPLITPITPENDRQEKALNYLKQWDGSMAEESQAATIFHVWMRHLRNQLYTAGLQEYWDKDATAQQVRWAMANTSLQQLRSALSEDAMLWCDDGTVDATKQPCSGVLRSSLNAAIDELEKYFGADMDDWHWGDIHQIVYNHTPFSNHRLFKHLFERRVASPGSPDSINVANASYRESEGYIQNFGAGFRQVIEFGAERDRYQYINSTGQSGHFLSPHYADMVEAFGASGLAELSSPDALTQYSELELRPAAGQGAL